MHCNLLKVHPKCGKNDKLLITGRRTDNGLWEIPLTTPPSPILSQPPSPHHARVPYKLTDITYNNRGYGARRTPVANGVIRLDQTKSELAQYLSGAMFNPAKSTLVRAVRKKHLITFPGLTTNLISKHLPKSLATSKGHLDQEFKNLRSTKTIKLPDIPDVYDEDIEPIQEPNNTKTNDIMCSIMDSSELRSKSYSDQTGKFPIKSASGNQYIFVMYHYDTNSIHATPIKSRHTTHITEAWEKTFHLLKSHGEAPDIHILDNECSFEMKQAFTAATVKFQLVPPHLHRRNAAERAIRTFKNHLIAGLCTCDSRFPASYWDKILPQAEITLNLLRSSRRNPSLSAYAAVHGQFDFNATPLAPPGTKVVVHHKKRKTYGVHGLEGWYIGPSMEHYRCYQIFLPSTRGTMNADTVDFFRETIPFPTVNTDQYLRQAATDILAILQAPEKNIPSLSYGSSVANAYVQIAQILKRATLPPTSKQTTNLHNQVASTPPVTPPRVPIITPPTHPMVHFEDPNHFRGCPLNQFLPTLRYLQSWLRSFVNKS